MTIAENARAALDHAQSALTEIRYNDNHRVMPYLGAGPVPVVPPDRVDRLAEAVVELAAVVNMLAKERLEQ